MYPTWPVGGPGPCPTVVEKTKCKNNNSITPLTESAMDPADVRSYTSLAVILDGSKCRKGDELPHNSPASSFAQALKHFRPENRQQSQCSVMLPSACATVDRHFVVYACSSTCWQSLLRKTMIFIFFIEIQQTWLLSVAEVSVLAARDCGFRHHLTQLISTALKH